MLVSRGWGVKFQCTDFREGGRFQCTEIREFLHPLVAVNIIGQLGRYQGRAVFLVSTGLVPRSKKK